MEIAMLSRSATVAEGVKSASTADGGKPGPVLRCTSIASPMACSVNDSDDLFGQ
jgi:hypothetical protein